MADTFRIALATPAFPKSVEHGMECVEKYIQQASERQASLVCFPEAYIPGMRGIDESIQPHSPKALEAALEKARELARRWRVAVILPMDWDDPRGILNVAMVISAEGEVLGYQTKNQLDPTEDTIFIPGNKRRLFQIAGVTFGIVICHEGFRYPESVRWAARNGASIVFHPYAAGSNYVGKRPTEFRGRENRFFEHAMMCRALENTIYFAGVNYAFTNQDSATCVVGPTGENLGFQPYGEEGLLVVDIDPTLATRRLALRYDASRHSEGGLDNEAQ